MSDSTPSRSMGAYSHWLWQPSNLLDEEFMRISLKAVTLASSLLWGFAMLLIGLIHLAQPSYGGEFLRVMSSVYPGADTAPTLGRVLLGTLYGLVDGAVAGCIFGWLYRFFSSSAAILPK